MGRKLVFRLGNNEYSFEPAKIERKSLYGRTETVALDDDGYECTLASMDESGTVIIPKGGIGLGVLSSDSRWVERSELIAVDSDGKTVKPLPSSFSVQITLENPASPEELLNHSITSVYELKGAGQYPDLMEAVLGKIYSFPFCYSDGYESSQAFLVESEGKLFMLAGIPCEFDFVGLREAGYLEEDDGDEDISEEPDIDFCMI